MDEEKEVFTFEHLGWRGVTRETMRFFNVATKVDKDGRPVSIAAPFGKNAAQIRDLNGTKNFRWQGQGSRATLFGMDRFPANGKSITITEGWLDALSVYEMLRTAVVSVRSAGQAKSDCVAEREYLNSFDRIYLAFDNDGPGQEALNQVASLFHNKIYILKLRWKDANDYLQKGQVHEFAEAWKHAKRYLPEGLVSSRDDFHRIVNEDSTRPAISYPYPTLTGLTGGIRTGEVVLVSADQGIGKTEIFRGIEYHLLKQTSDNLGIIHLEEDAARQLKGLAGLELGVPAHTQDSSVTNEEINAVNDKLLFQDDNPRLHIYSLDNPDDPDVILDRIRFMVAGADCKYIFLDHIGFLVAAFVADDERRRIDYISTKLSYLVKELNFTLFMAAHVNKNGDIRGSTYPSKVAHIWIHLDRDLTQSDQQERNRTYLTVRKNRPLSKTGPAGCLIFNPETFSISEEFRGEPPTE